MAVLESILFSNALVMLESILFQNYWQYCNRYLFQKYWQYCNRYLFKSIGNTGIDTFFKSIGNTAIDTFSKVLAILWAILKSIVYTFKSVLPTLLFVTQPCSIVRNPRLLRTMMQFNVGSYLIRVTGTSTELFASRQTSKRWMAHKSVWQADVALWRRRVYGMPLVLNYTAESVIEITNRKSKEW